MKVGYIGLMGNTNAGKSTLLNALVGEKVAIVNPKPQTTRNRLTGIRTDSDSQLMFVDTPGVHRAQKGLNDFMMKLAKKVASDVDVCAVVVDATKFRIEDLRYYRDLTKDLNPPLVVILNKVDLIKDKSALLPIMEKIHAEGYVKEIFPLSALKGDGIEKLVSVLKNYVPEGVKLYPDDLFTDLTINFLISEFIRDKAYTALREELPYSLAVTVDAFTERDTLTKIQASIIVEKESQKGIIIGKGGSMLKKIGTQARIDIEDLLEKKVFLELHVTVVKNWTDDLKQLKKLGYDIEEY